MPVAGRFLCFRDQRYADVIVQKKFKAGLPAQVNRALVYQRGIGYAALDATEVRKMFHVDGAPGQAPRSQN